MYVCDKLQDYACIQSLYLCILDSSLISCFTYVLIHELLRFTKIVYVTLHTVPLTTINGKHKCCQISALEIGLMSPDLRLFVFYCTINNLAVSVSISYDSHNMVWSLQQAETVHRGNGSFVPLDCLSLLGSAELS